MCGDAPTLTAQTVQPVRTTSPQEPVLLPRCDVVPAAKWWKPRYASKVLATNVGRRGPANLLLNFWSAPAVSCVILAQRIIQ